MTVIHYTRYKRAPAGKKAITVNNIYILYKISGSTIIANKKDLIETTLSFNCFTKLLTKPIVINIRKKNKPNHIKSSIIELNPNILFTPEQTSVDSIDAEIDTNKNLFIINKLCCFRSRQP